MMSHQFLQVLRLELVLFRKLYLPHKLFLIMCDLPYPKTLSVRDAHKTWEFVLNDDSFAIIDDKLYCEVAILNPDTGEPEMYPDNDPAYRFYTSNVFNVLELAVKSSIYHRMGDDRISEDDLVFDVVTGVELDRMIMRASSA